MLLGVVLERRHRRRALLGEAEVAGPGDHELAGHVDAQLLRAAEHGDRRQLVDAEDGVRALRPLEQPARGGLERLLAVFGDLLDPRLEPVLLAPGAVGPQRGLGPVVGGQPA